jgi:hypothetical protein
LEGPYFNVARIIQLFTIDLNNFNKGKNDNRFLEGQLREKFNRRNKVGNEETALSRGNLQAKGLPKMKYKECFGK